MIEPGATGSGTPSERSLAACVGSLLELAPDAVPISRGGPPLLVAVRQWLAELGLGLVAVADPQTFSWAGPWIAQLTGDDRSDRYVIMFGVPSGVIFDPLGQPDASGQIKAGYLLAALEPPHPLVASVPHVSGRVEAIFVAAQAGAPMRPLDEVRAVAGRGLEGDRYSTGEGTFSVPGGRGNEITLIAGEVLDRLELPDGRSLSGGEARRNLVTRGVDLNALVGQRFRIGELELIGRRRCEPCAHLQRLTRPGALRALVHRGGLRADLLSTGTLRVGDLIASPDGHG